MGCSNIGTVEQKKYNIPIQENLDLELMTLKKEEKVNNFVKEKLKNALDFKYRDISGRNNNPYFQLRKFESESLIEKFLTNNYIFEQALKNCPQLNLNLGQNLINEIIQREDVVNVYTEKIINKIKEFKNDKNKFKIEYLTALLVGKRKIGKKKLIKYMLQLNNEKPNETYKFFRKYRSSNVKNLQLIKYKGIGYDNNNNADIISDNTISFIKEQISKGNYNNFVHCIWYCLSGTRVEDVEISYLQKLKRVYNDDTMPIIIVYIDESIPEETEKYIKKFLPNIEIVSVVPKDIRLPNGRIRRSRGVDKLMELTLDKIMESLRGNMQIIMTKNIKDELSRQIRLENNKIKLNIINSIIDDFISNYREVKSDSLFIDYLLTILGRNLTEFFKNISNSSLNLIIKSGVIRNISTFMNAFKNSLKNLIEQDVNIIIKDFIDKQVIMEKKYRTNIEIKNKRTLDGFKQTSILFLKENCYYLCQKYIIEQIFIFCGCFKNMQKSYSYYDAWENILNDNTNYLINGDEYINILIKDLLNSKLKNLINLEDIGFIENQRQGRINQYNNRIGQHEDLDLNEFFNNSLEINLENNEELRQLVDLPYNDELRNSNNNINTIRNSSLSNDLSNKLYNHLLRFSFLSVKNYYKQITDIPPLNQLLNYIKTDLEIFLKNKHINFFKFLSKYNGNKFAFNNNNNNLSTILEKKEKNNYDKKIEGIINDKTNYIKSQKDLLPIDYLSIIIAGKSGVGKSTLINCLLKEELAKEEIPKIGTKKPKSYKNNKVPFLQLIDTRGVELIQQYGNDKILKDVKDIISNPSIVLNDGDGNFNFTYNDNIQCMWYCVTNKDLDNQDITFVKSLQEGNKNLIIIIVFTRSSDLDKIESMEKDVKAKLGDIPFHHLLARDLIDEKTGEIIVQSYGLKELIYKTINEYQKNLGCKITKGIRDIINEQLILHCNEENERITKNVYNSIAIDFIQSYNEPLNDQMFNSKICDYVKALIVELVKIEEKTMTDINQDFEKDFLKPSLSKYLYEFITYYKSEIKKIIDTVKDEKAIDYLNAQAITEISKQMNMNIINKCNKDEFIKIIEEVLQNNFYYTAQKYYIYHFLDIYYNNYSQFILNKFNNMAENIIKESKYVHYFEKIYQEKINNLKERIVVFCEIEGWA